MPHNIILVMTDQQRADHAGFLAGSRMATPNLDRLAESAAFSSAVTVNPICTPARTALLTGKYTHQIGMLDMSGDLSQQHPTYLQALQRAGYWTAAVGKLHWMQNWPWGTPVGQGHDLVGLKSRVMEYGLDYLWEVSGKQLATKNYCEYAQHLDRQGLLDAYREHVAQRGPNNQVAAQTQWTGAPWPFPEEHYVDNVTGDQGLRALEQRPANQPFFLFLSFCGPHKPYDPPQSCLEAIPPDETDDFIVAGEPMDAATKQRLYGVRRAYRAMIHCIDLQVGRLLEYLESSGLLDNTVILFTSDHGEMMGDRGRMSKAQPWRQAINVPTAIRHPDHLSRRVIDSPIELTDLTATVLDVAGVDPEEALSKPWPAFHNRVPCRSLLPLVRQETDQIREFAFSECRAQWQALVAPGWKYIRRQTQPDGSPAAESLYHTATDPDECHDLASDPAQGERLAWFRERRDALLDTTPAAQTGWAPFG